ncbi:MAG TPA: DALR domain-containing protein, partial [Candidatus Nanoarchaeia archaeon]|nr:DALR domain-containing protein [Candidatus Nanoarchaeia archaeon]
ASLGRINNFLFQLRHNPKQEYNPDLRERLNKLEHGFMDAMDNDFNTPIALAEIFGFINYANEVVHEGEYNHKNADEIENYFRKLDKVFKSFSFEEGNHGEIDRTVVESLIAERTKAKKKKDWATADTLREKLKGMGVELFDKKDGATDYKITKSS